MEITWCIDCGIEFTGEHDCRWPGSRYFDPEKYAGQIKNVSTPKAREVWRSVHIAAERAPDWAKKQIEAT